LKEIEGVSGVLARPSTGSIILHHDGPLSAIAEQATALQICDFSEDTAATAESAFKLPEPEQLAAIALAGLAGVQAFRGRVLPPTATLLWYAASLAGVLKAGNIHDPDAG
jgi:hypothetical protein